MKYDILNALYRLNECRAVEILFKMAEVHPETFETFLLGAVEVEVPATPDDYQPYQASALVKFSPEEWVELKAFGKDHKISCIKRIREFTGLGLWQSKWIADEKLGHKVLPV